MRQLTPEGQEAVSEIARRNGVSAETALALLEALAQSHGSSAQFNLPELGGRGQWMRGGMTQVGDMFDHALKAKVDGLCTELSALLGREPRSSADAASSAARGQSQQQGSGMGSGKFGTMTSFFGSDSSSSEWWPDGLGQPSSAGSQNTVRYAYFPDARRLAIDRDGKITVHDTLDHQISGVSQQQSDRYSLSFTSQKGVVWVDDLPIVTDEEPPGPSNDVPRPPVAPKSAAAPEPPSAPAVPPPVAAAPPKSQTGDDAIALIERLAQLRDKGILSEGEFAAKKTELLSRL